jgi:hypothetical protein
MRSAAAAIAWEFRARHRWGVRALAVYVAVLIAIKVALVASGRTVTLESGEAFAFVVMLPLSTTFMYFMAVFSYGLAGDLAARQSMFPRRLFTLPVTTGALAGWPMLYGTIAMALLWVATRVFARFPAEIEMDVPVVWPAVLAACMVAWMQALTWMPYPLPGMRVIVTIVVLTSLDAIVFTAIELKVPEGVMLALLAPHLPLAYLTARSAVARGRRGDVPDWSGLPARVARIAGLTARRRNHFHSAARAQAWFEWRRHGRSLPALVALLLPFELGFLFLIRDTPALVFYTLAAVLVTPPFMAGFVAATVSRPNPNARDSHGVSPFMATRPLSTAALIAAPLEATIWSTAAAWALVLAAIPLAVYFSDTSPVVMEKVRAFHDTVGTPRAIVVALLVGAGLIASTWKRLVHGLYIGLTGREWLIKGNVFLTLSFLCAAGPVIYWIGEREVLRALWGWFVWILVVLVFLKMSAVAWIATRLHDGRLLSDGAFLRGAASWSAAVFALYGVLVWLVDSPFIPRYMIMLLAILAVPLARVSAAPLALAWNRHR